jgi:hypothetical protein
MRDIRFVLLAAVWLVLTLTVGVVVGTVAYLTRAVHISWLRGWHAADRDIVLVVGRVRGQA